ncbi:hypothetical protein [Flavobacterium psychrotolerans]|uniref:GTP-binding protein n=1 Tax=Flavobacterium psychrotolerans TaxID=2169410 RepID=A0A2U1JFQ2_9FLAO|nr:hypothetical protein [Flavobacterium psychrotolerans]PWA03960.1 hypothetical protein DB895_13540 [Flavobacterium psychrotolerans]
MDATHEIRLRLRFYKDIDETIATVQQKFKEYAQKKSPDFKIKVCEDHIWFYIIGLKKQYWSPHLHLHLEPKGEKETHIRGLFGPDPTLWTFFMFLHFIVAGIFTIFGMIAYSNYMLKQSYMTDLAVMALMVFVWFLLYFIARQIRFQGNGQMEELEKLFLDIVKK